MDLSFGGSPAFQSVADREPSRWENPPAADVLWVAFVSFARNLFFNLLVKYFSSYLVDRDHKPPPLSPPPIPAEASYPQPE